MSMVLEIDIALLLIMVHGRFNPIKRYNFFLPEVVNKKNSQNTCQDLFLPSYGIWIYPLQWLLGSFKNRPSLA